MSACPPVRPVEITPTSGGKSPPPGSAAPSPDPESPDPLPGERSRWAADLSASITVFLIALPLSLGIALATGAPLQAGLVAAAVGGVIGGRLGGAPLQVSGPAAGLTVITAELIQTYGWRTTCAITVLAGLTQLTLSCFRVARSALVVSPAIVHGMLGGIGVTIALAQLHIVLGGDPESSAIANILALPAQLADPHPFALSVSALTVAVLLGWPLLRGRQDLLGRLARYAPAALVAVALATLLASLSGMRLPRVDLPSWRSHALPSLPEGPVLGLMAAVLTVTLVASVESLLSAVAVDKLTAKRPAGQRVPRADLDRELRGQGASNVVSGALGGLPVTGVAVRSAANVSAGAVSRRSAILHGLWVLLAAGLLVGMLELIPLAALGALVMVVGVQMVNLTHVRSVTRHREVLVYLATGVGVVLFGVLEGVALGIAVAVGVALQRLARTRITLDSVRGRSTGEGGPTPRHELGGVRSSAGAVGRFADSSERTSSGGEPSGVGAREGDGTDHLGGRPGPSADGPAGGAAHPGERRSPDGEERAGADIRADLEDAETTYRVRVRGQLTFLAVPRLSRVLAQVPEGTRAVVELDGSFMDHAAYETLEDWRTAHSAQGGTARVIGAVIGTKPAAPHCSPWTPWRKRGYVEAPAPQRFGHPSARRHQLLGGVRYFQSRTAPLVRDELARLAQEGQEPSHLFITCADSRMVPSMITSSGPGDLFTVRNVGNLVPTSGCSGREAPGDESVAAAIEYAVDVLGVESITVCGHSGCGAMLALHSARNSSVESSLHRWLRHGYPSLERLSAQGASGPRLADRETADECETLCLANVVQQLEHLTTHECVARRMREGALELHGMYFHVGEAQAYVMDLVDPDSAGQAPPVFAAVREEPLVSSATS
ncbi:transporter [Streptomyces sp. AJS327]|uniref:SulP family inorganic anion transporter n=1 Tax=Streptomyces sp. AJS327 TaxID=2545265 RepID=UPI0015DDDEA5|nr:SulP family inorganic anion transporter [Streptomyces sp. AJS327]MBA0053523.1 transporter [Streptomyces sp. AJS327]